MKSSIFLLFLSLISLSIQWWGSAQGQGKHNPNVNHTLHANHTGNPNHIGRGPNTFLISTDLTKEELKTLLLQQAAPEVEAPEPEEPPEAPEPEEPEEPPAPEEQIQTNQYPIRQQKHQKLQIHKNIHNQNRTRTVLIQQETQEETEVEEAEVEEQPEIEEVTVTVNPKTKEQIIKKKPQQKQHKEQKTHRTQKAAGGVTNLMQVNEGKVPQKPGFFSYVAGLLIALTLMMLYVAGSQKRKLYKQSFKASNGQYNEYLLYNEHEE